MKPLTLEMEKDEEGYYLELCIPHETYETCLYLYGKIPKYYDGNDSLCLSVWPTLSERS